MPSLPNLKRNLFMQNCRHHQCKRMDLSKDLKKEKDSAPCAGKLLSGNHNEAGIPLRITEIVCPSEMGDRCIQLVLPMQVAISGAKGLDDQMSISVRSGCIDGSDVKKKSTRKSQRQRNQIATNKEIDTKKNKALQRSARTRIL
ncbi:Uncharacterized protein APZ42_023725 [Daphnia magna]|uniref:Uncharacterized protein n=1 Tax=Daphnia magna TaxID=35525 RepID=A0A164UQL0_9CRUS|nr:Uncharacterized protein APZ42_023725 [Daphnia magna]